MLLCAEVPSPGGSFELDHGAAVEAPTAADDGTSPPELPSAALAQRSGSTLPSQGKRYPQDHVGGVTNYGVGYGVPDPMSSVLAAVTIAPATGEQHAEEEPPAPQRGKKRPRVSANDTGEKLCGSLVGLGQYVILAGQVHPRESAEVSRLSTGRSQVETSAMRVWTACSKSQSNKLFSAADAHVFAGIASNAETASRLLSAGGAQEAARVVAGGQLPSDARDSTTTLETEHVHVLTGVTAGSSPAAQPAGRAASAAGTGAESGAGRRHLADRQDTNLQPAAFAADPGFTRLDDMYPTSALAIAGRHAMLDALCNSGPTSVDGPQQPGDVHAFLAQVAAELAEMTKQLPQVGESVLAYFPKEAVSFALAFVVSSSHPGLDNMPAEKVELLQDPRYLPIMWCMNPGDVLNQVPDSVPHQLAVPVSKLLRAQQAAVPKPTAAQTVEVAVASTSDASITFKHALLATALDVVALDNVVAAGSLAVPDIEATCATSQPIYVHGKRHVTQQEVISRTHIPFVATSEGGAACTSAADLEHSHAGGTGLNATCGVPGCHREPGDDCAPGGRSMPAGTSKTEEWKLDRYALLHSPVVYSWTPKEHEAVASSIDHLSTVLQRQFTNLPWGGAVTVTVVRKIFDTSLSVGAFVSPAAKEVKPYGRCGRSGETDTPCQWVKREQRPRGSVLSGSHGIVEIRLQGYRCKTHDAHIEVGTRSFFNQFEQLYPGSVGLQLSVPLIPITGKIHMDETAASELWGMYCANYKDGVASISRLFQRHILRKLRRNLLEADALGLSAQFQAELQEEHEWMNSDLVAAIRFAAFERVLDMCAALVCSSCSEAIVDSAIFQLHSSIISPRMPAYWAAMVRFASVLGVDFTFKSAARFMVSVTEGGKRRTARVHANLSTVVGLHGFLVAGHIGGGNESSLRIYGTIMDVFHKRQALSRELGTAAVPVTAVAVDNPASSQNTIELASKTSWPVQSVSECVQVHMDLWHFAQRVRSVTMKVHLPDAGFLRKVWSDFSLWVMSPHISLHIAHSSELSAILCPAALRECASELRQVQRAAHRVQQTVQGSSSGTQSTADLTKAAQTVMCTCAGCEEDRRFPAEDLFSMQPVVETSQGTIYNACPGSELCCQMRAAVDYCCLQMAAAQWLHYGGIRDTCVAGCKRSLQAFGLALVAPLCGEVLTGQDAQCWEPLQCFIHGHVFDIPGVILVAMARAVGAVLAQSPHSTQDAVGNSGEAEQRGSSSGADSAQPTDTSSVPPMHSGSTSEGGYSGSLPVPAEWIGPSTLLHAQAEGWRIIQLFCIKHRMPTHASLESMVLTMAAVAGSELSRDTENTEQPAQSASQNSFEGLNTAAPAEGWKNLQIGSAHAIHSASSSISNGAPRRAALAALVDCSQPGSMMARADVAKAALNSVQNKNALNGLMQQQSFSIHFGGTNHAEAAHSRLSAALGPSSALGIEKAEQRLELHALHHNRKKALALLQPDTKDRRGVAQAEDLKELAQLGMNVVKVAACGYSQHRLATGPIFKAIMSSPVAKQKSLAELEQQGIDVTAFKSPTMSVALQGEIVGMVEQAVADEASGTARYKLSTLAKRIKSKVSVPNVSAAQIKATTRELLAQKGC